MTEYRNWIGGEWVTGDGVSVNLNPSDLDDVIGEYSRASQVQVGAASRQRQGPSGATAGSCVGSVDFHVPFGGRKQSSYGPHEQGRHAIELYTTAKTAYTAA